MKQQSGTSARTTAGLDSATDAAVWQVAAHETPEAFAIIFDRHADAVQRYCARRAGSADAADDLVSLGIRSRIAPALACATKKHSTGCRAPRRPTTPTAWWPNSTIAGD